MHNDGVIIIIGKLVLIGVINAVSVKSNAWDNSF